LPIHPRARALGFLGTHFYKIVLEPERDAVWLSLHGKKIAKISLEELESESIEEQRKYIEGSSATSKS
jgi:hypothetical protein